MHVGDSLGDPQPPRATGWGDRSNSRVDVSETLDWTRQRDDLQGHPSQVPIAPRIFASGIAGEDRQSGFDFGAISDLMLGCRCDSCEIPQGDGWQMPMLSTQLDSRECATADADISAYLKVLANDIVPDQCEDANFEDDSESNQGHTASNPYNHPPQTINHRQDLMIFPRCAINRNFVPNVHAKQSLIRCETPSQLRSCL